MVGTGTIIISLVIATAVLGTIGLGVGYLIWLKMRPKKELFTAMIYQLSEGRRFARDKTGRIVGKIELADLKPYGIDILEKVEEGPGITRYRLQKLKKNTPAIGGSSVEFWGTKKKIVHVLYHEGSCVLMEKGYDLATETLIYNPIPYDRINIIKDEIHERKSKLNKQSKDILQAILPFVGIILSMVMVFAIAYVTVQGMIQVADINKEAAKTSQESIKDLARMYGVDQIQEQRGQTATTVQRQNTGVQNRVIVVD